MLRAGRVSMAAAAAGLAVVLWLAVGPAPTHRVQADAHDPAAGLTICVDAGHGGGDPGAVNGGLRESDINLDIARYLRDAWSGRFEAVVMTRDGDDTLSSRDRYEACNSAGADLLVSVHTNSSSNSTQDGTLTIYFHPEDRVLAGFLQESMWNSLPTDVPHDFTNFGLKRDALGVLLKSKMPSATVEPVMMSHPWEATRLAATTDCSSVVPTNCRRVQIAEAIIAGVDAYLARPAEEPDGSGGGPDCDRNPNAGPCRR